MRKLILIIVMVLLPGIVQAQIYDAFDSIFVITPADTVTFTVANLPTGASPGAVLIHNFTAASTLLVDMNGSVPVLTYGPFTANCKILVGANSQTSQSYSPQSVILWVPAGDDSCLMMISWMYRP